MKSKYKIKPTMFKKTDRIVIYFKRGSWHMFTFTDCYLINKQDKKQVIEMCCEMKKVKPINVKICKWVEIIGEEE